MAYLTTARLESGSFVAEALNLHRIDLDSLERETHLVSYACRYLSDPLRTRFLEEVDPAGSVKKGKKTNQLIFGYDFVGICAFHLQEQGRSGKGRKGSEGRHVHVISEEDRGQDVMSGFRENATMVIAVDTRYAMRQGVQFYRSRNGVVLTSDRILPASILHYESLRDHQKYDRRGNPM
eukprot:s7472_g2.t1